MLVVAVRALLFRSVMLRVRVPLLRNVTPFENVCFPASPAVNL
jgi:hypothetical protein